MKSLLVYTFIIKLFAQINLFNYYYYGLTSSSVSTHSHTEFVACSANLKITIASAFAVGYVCGTADIINRHEWHRSGNNTVFERLNQRQEV
jgi:hypothetical protein